jgi:hypothetical protein
MWWSALFGALALLAAPAVAFAQGSGSATLDAVRARRGAVRHRR